jgi:hypothetical protein
MPFGMGPYGWLMAGYGYPYWGWRCRWFPWLPRWWWTGAYGPITPFTTTAGYTMPAATTPSMAYPSPYGVGYPSMGVPQLSNEQERQMLEGQATAIQRQLDQIRKRLEELGKA